MKNKRYLFLLVLILVIFSSISVFANDWAEMELITEEDGQPVGTYFIRGTIIPYRFSSSRGGVSNSNGEGVWTLENKSFSDKTMMQMMRRQIPNDRIIQNPKPTVELPQAIKDYLANGGSVDNVKIKFLAKDLGEGQDWRNGYNAIVPTGPVFNPDYFYVELPKYKINPQNGTVEIEYKYALKHEQLDGTFYSSFDDPNMKATVMKMNSIYGFNGFSMWTQGRTHRGSTSSQGTYNVRQLPSSQTLTKDKIVDATGKLVDGLVLHNLEGYKPEYKDTITTPDAKIGHYTFAKGGSIGYALHVPLYLKFYLAETNNIRIGSEQYKIGDNYNARVVDVATNKVLDPETDKLFIGKKYRMDYFAGYESTKGDKVKTNNAPIVTNFYMYYNGRNSSNPSDLHIPNIRDLDNLPYLEKANKEKETLNSEKWDESKIDTSKIAKYQHEFEIEKIDKHGKKVEKARVCAYLPYQYSFYTEYNGDKSLGDNDVRNDDHACLEFEVDTSEAKLYLNMSVKGFFYIMEYI